MAMDATVIYENHLKKAYSVRSGEKVLAITDTSCYTLAEETAWLTASLPESGAEGDYLASLSGLGLTDPQKIFGRLIEIGAMREKAGRTWGGMLGAVFSPKLRLLSAQLQERTFAFLGVGPNGLAKAMSVLSWPAGLGLAWGALYLAAPALAVPVSPEGKASASVVVALVIAGSLLHELGHSLAAAASGIGLRPIGFSVYLIYPVFYTNVSGIDRLKLGPKALIDCGGFILQSVFILVLLLFVSAGGSASAAEAVRWIMAIMLFNLNPLFRTDGYWLYKDTYAELKHNRWMHAAHHLYLAAFVAFSVYFLWLLAGRAGHIWSGLNTLARSPGYFFSGGYQIVLGAYFILVGFAGGVKRFKEGHQEWKELKNPPGPEVKDLPA